jgi:hypothetical protein
MAVITFVDGGLEGGRPDNSLPGINLPPGGVTLPVFPFDPTDPGFGVGRPDRPDQGLPGHGHPDQDLPGRPARPDQGLPGSGARPDQGLPGSGGRPDQGLPPSGARPDAGLPMPGKRYVVKWLACHGLILVPDQGLPAPPPPTTDNTLPPAPAPKT